MENESFVHYLLNFDIICLTETFVDSDFVSPIFHEYVVFISKAKKLSRQGRYSGGVIVMVKKSKADFFERIQVETESVIVLKIQKHLFNTGKDVMFICTYIHPSDSDFWKTHQETFGMEVIEQCILDLQSTHGDFFLMITGDLNARTACSNYSAVSDDDFENLHLSTDTVHLRQSQDGVVNMFGNQLIELCNVFDCIVLNGLCKSGFDDSCTFIGPSGSSVVDYFIVSLDLFSSVNFLSLEVENIIESDHLPVSLKIEFNSNTSSDTCEPQQERKKVNKKYIWNKDKETDFLAAMQSDEVQSRLSLASEVLENDIDRALSIFVTCLKDASTCMLKNVSTVKTKRSEWFDEECKIAKKQCRVKLKKFRATRNEDDRITFVTERRSYKRLLKTKQREYKKQKTERLANNISDSSQFWKEVRNMGCGKTEKTDNDISKDDWFTHFRDVFQNHVDGNVKSCIDADLTEGTDHILNKVITEEEVKKAIDKLKLGKSCGLDDVTAEMLKCGGKCVLDFMVHLFNAIFSSGTYPKEWSKAIIVPIHKKGDRENTDNYRGISLLSIISKCYTAILNTRLYDWLEDGSMISDSQAGFRKGFSTVDQIFNLYAAVQKCQQKKGRKLYVAFVDFRKAFDSVRHDKLLECLKVQGVKGKFLCSLKSMYQSLLSCVRANCELTEFFDCPVGVRQGCVLSPTLFSVFINQLANHVDANGRHGVQMLPGLMELFILLFADDVALLSTSIIGLQNQLDVLSNCCTNMKLAVNINKTKIMVFRKGGYLGRREQWFFDGHKLDVVNNYCYLGFNFTTMLSVKRGTEHLATKGKKAVIQLNKAFQKYKEMSSNTFFKIFDAKIQPVLLYASEIWGLSKLDHIEKVHLLACKRFLCVPVRTPNKMVYGDLGRYPLHVNSCISALRYWLRLLQMHPDRLSNQAYRMLLELDKCNKSCWVSGIREILCTAGFGFVWLQQGVGDVHTFLCQFRQRLIDMFTQEWYTTIRDRDRYDSYRNFKIVFEKEKYVLEMDTYCFRVAISQVRMNVLPLNNNVHRYSSEYEKKLCPFCKEIEDENHFLNQCSVYDDLREKFLNDSARIPINCLFSAKSSAHRYKLSRFVFHAINRRKHMIH